METSTRSSWTRGSWGGVERAEAELAGRAAVRLSGAGVLVWPRGVTLEDGVLEADLAVTREWSFHGVAWRVADESNYESFFVRPHQVGNPDAIQYTPVFNGLSAWQLYHGDGFWHPARFPVDEWFTVRVEFADDRLRAHVAGSVVLDCTRLRHAAEAGRVGILVGGDDLLLGALRWSAEPPAPGAAARAAGWRGSFAVGGVGGFAERDLAAQLDAEHDWTTLDAEPAASPISPASTRFATGPTPCSRASSSTPIAPVTSARARLQRPGGRAPERHAALPRRRLVPLTRLPLPRQHRLVRHGLPAAAGGAERAGARDQRELRRLGRASPLPGRGRAAFPRPAYAPRAKMPSPPSSVSKKRLASSRCS